MDWNVNEKCDDDGICGDNQFCDLYGTNYCQSCEWCTEFPTVDGCSVCLLYRCDPPPTISNGYQQLIPKSSYIFGTRAFYVCSEGYWLKNPRAYYLECLKKDRTWSGEMPVCETIPSNNVMSGTTGASVINAEQVSSQDQNQIVTISIGLILVIVLLGILVSIFCKKKKLRNLFKSTMNSSSNNRTEIRNPRCRSLGTSIELGRQLSTKDDKQNDAGGRLLKECVTNENIRTVFDQPQERKTRQTLLPERMEMLPKNLEVHNKNASVDTKDGKSSDKMADLVTMCHDTNYGSNSGDSRDPQSKDWQTDTPSSLTGAGYSADKSSSNEGGSMFENESRHNMNDTDTPLKEGYDHPATKIENGHFSHAPMIGDFNSVGNAPSYPGVSKQGDTTLSCHTSTTGSGLNFQSSTKVSRSTDPSDVI